MVAHSDDKRRWNATPEQALMEIKHLQDAWAHVTPGMRVNSLKYFANTAALSTGDSDLFPDGRKGGEVTPGALFTQLNDVLEKWETLQSWEQQEAVRYLAKAAVVTADGMEVGSELAELRTEAQQSALGPIVRFQQDVLSSINASNAVVVAGAALMAEGAKLIAGGLKDVSNRRYDRGAQKILLSLELCVGGAILTALMVATLTVGYTAALVGVKGVAEKVAETLDAFVAMCTKAIATVKAMDVNAMSHEQIVSATTDTVAPVVNAVSDFCKTAVQSMSASFKEADFGATVKAGLSTTYQGVSAMLTALVDGFDAASRGMSMGDLAPSQVQSAVKNANDLSNTLGTHTNEMNMVLERASAALADLSAKFIDGDGKSSDLAKVDKAELGAAAKDFTQAVQDGQMASLNQAEVQAAQGQQQSSGRGRGR